MRLRWWRGTLHRHNANHLRRRFLIDSISPMASIDSPRATAHRPLDLLRLNRLCWSHRFSGLRYRVSEGLQKAAYFNCSRYVGKRLCFAGVKICCLKTYNLSPKPASSEHPTFVVVVKCAALQTSNLSSEAFLIRFIPPSAAEKPSISCSTASASASSSLFSLSSSASSACSNSWYCHSEQHQIMQGFSWVRWSLILARPDP